MIVASLTCLNRQNYHILFPFSAKNVSQFSSWPKSEFYIVDGSLTCSKCSSSFWGQKLLYIAPQENPSNAPKGWLNVHVRCLIIWKDIFRPPHYSSTNCLHLHLSDHYSFPLKLFWTKRTAIKTPNWQPAFPTISVINSSKATLGA